MIVRILSRGKSFKGLATYLTHDADQEKTAERVAWTHTHNLANDDVPCAVDEMLRTARNAELLKQEAGVRAGGRATENAVKHLSLNWAPDEAPTREHMIETTEDFLRRMKWQEHQAILVAHDDKAHRHVHVMLNVIHPETGLRLDDNFERRRAQVWALDYERTQGRVYCEQRLKPPEEREKAPPRNIWMAFQENEKKFLRHEELLREIEPISPDEAENWKNQKNNEWKALKEIQRNERMQFITEGKSEFRHLKNSIYREIREEFRDRWRDFYGSADQGDPEERAALRAAIIADQKAVLDARRDSACRDLWWYREGLRHELLDEQRAVRHELRARQEAGLDSAPFLRSLMVENAGEDIRTAFREAAEATTRPDADERQADRSNARELAHEESHDQTAASRGRGLGSELSLGAMSLFDSLLSVFEGMPRARSRQVDTGSFEAAADEIRKRERERDDREGREKQRAFYGE